MRAVGEAQKYRYYVDRDGILGRKLVLSEEEGLLGLGQILRGQKWVYCFLDPHSVAELGEGEARERAGAASLDAAASGPSGDHEAGRDVYDWGTAGSGSGKAIAGDVRDIEAEAKRAGRELTPGEARECAGMLETLEERYRLAWEFSRGTPMPDVQVQESANRPKVRLAQTGGDWLEIGGKVEGTLALAETEGRLDPGTAARFKREGMPPPFGEAPMAEYREMLRHLLATAAKYVEVEDGYPECDDEPVPEP